MASILSAVSSVVTSAISWATSYITLITGNDALLLFCIALPLVGLGIGIIRRLVSIRA